MLRRSTGVACALVLAFVAPATAQTWETPTFFSPRPHDDIGVYVTKPEVGDWGVQGIWRQSAGINLGVRGGIGGDSDDRSVLIGAELYGPISIEGTESLWLAWVTGIGASFNGVTQLRVPLGVSVGFSFGVEDGALITPYIHPRAAFDLVTFETADGDDETDTDFDVDVDLGADLEIARRWIIRVGYKVGGNDVFGFGLGFKTGRGAAVR